MKNNYLAFLGLSKKAGALEIGDEAARAAISAGKVRVVLIASDSSDRTSSAFEFFSESANIPCIKVSETRAELGNALGRRPCAVVAVCDIGIAAALVKKLSAANEEAKACLDMIEAKAKKIAERKKTSKRNKSSK